MINCGHFIAPELPIWSNVNYYKKYLHCFVFINFYIWFLSMLHFDFVTFADNEVSSSNAADTSAKYQRRDDFFSKTGWYPFQINRD